MNIAQILMEGKLAMSFTPESDQGKYISMRFDWCRSFAVYEIGGHKALIGFTETRAYLLVLDDKDID